MQSRSISVEYAPADEHAGSKWRLRAPNAFGGQFTLEIDLNYVMRIPLYGVYRHQPFNLDEDYLFDFGSVAFEELFAGKIKALLERSAARDLYDIWMLSRTTFAYDQTKLRKATILLGVTCTQDWRTMDIHSIDDINQKMIDEQLTPLLTHAASPSVE